MATRIQLRRDTASNWTVANPVMSLGEPGFETDTLRLKVGDGVTAWNALAYSSDPAGLSVEKTGDTMTGPLIVETNAATAAVRITQEGTGPALTVEDAANPDLTPFTVASDGKVGIGTSAPAQLLDVNANSNTYVSVKSSNGGIAGVVFGKQDDAETASIQMRHDTNEFRINGYNNAPRFSITQSGNIGIGTVLPESHTLLEVAGNIQSGSNTPSIYLKQENGANDEKYWSIGVDSEVLSIKTYSDDLTTTSFDAIKIGRGNEENIDYVSFHSAGGDERMRVDSTGYVGIGTINPAALLDIRDITTSTNLYVGGSGDANVMRLGVGSGDSLAIYTNLINESVRITGTGNVGIGTTSPQSILHLQDADSSSTEHTLRSISASNQTTYQRANGTTASPSALLNNDQIGVISFEGFDSGSYTEMAKIVAVADDDIGTGDSPSRLEFYTTPDLSSTPTAAMVIDSDGLIYGSGASLGAWTSYTPSVSANSGTLGSTTETGYYTQIGKTVIFRFDVSITDQGTSAGAALILTLPVAAVSSYAGSGTVRETDSNGKQTQAYNSSTTQITLNYYDNSGVVATGTRFRGTFIYEAA